MATHETAGRTTTTTMLIDRTGLILAVDDAFTGLTGLPAAVRGQNVRRLFSAVDRDRLPADFGQLAAGGVAVPLPGIRLDLTPSLHRHFLVDLLPPIDTVAAPNLALRLRAIPGDLVGSGGDPGHSHGRDADARTPLHTAILDQVQAAIIATDPLGNVIFWNRHAEHLFGWTRDETIGQSISTVTVGPEDADVAAEIMSQLAAGQSWDGDFPVRCKDGSSRWLRVSDTPVFDDAGALVAIVGVSLDVSPQKAVEVELQHRAFHDALTELPNRAHFTRQLDAALGRAADSQGRVAIVLFDLDRFKAVNDLLGHARGDEVLVTAARRLKTELAPTVSVSRFGGDEFAALLVDVDDAAVERVAARIQAILAPPLLREGWEFHLAASIGVAVSDTSITTAHQLLRAADMALYQAKAKGGGSICRYQGGAGPQPDRWFSLEADLRRALIAGGEFIPYFQPIVDLTSGAPIAVEALLRWRHPALGLLMPAVFLPLAEEIGVLDDLGAWIFEQACLQSVAWTAQFGDGAPVINVNLATSQVRSGAIVAQVQQALARTQADPTRLRLEIDEGTVIDELRGSSPVLREVRQLGVRLAVDDFGRGATSLAALGDIEFDMLKIDRTLVSTMAGNQRVQAVVRALAGLAHDLGSAVTVEGIETAEQRDTARALGCDAGQGFLLAEPGPPSAITAWLAARLR